MNPRPASTSWTSSEAPSVNTTTSKEWGIQGEERALSFLEEKGFEILSRNFRHGRAGEIDLIARKDRLLLFVEVKSRRTPWMGGSLYSISQRKKRTLKAVASRFLSTRPDLYTRDIVCRFDMISVLDGRVEWIEDIFR